VGVVKLAPELPIDLSAPFVHFERSFMHLGFHIYDVGFQSRNSEAGRPMVFVTTLVLIGLILLLNAFAIYIRARLKRAYRIGEF
jgi:phosphate transport system permease protein